MAKSQRNSLKKSKDKNLSDYKFKTDNYTKAFTFSKRDLTTGRLKMEKRGDYGQVTEKFSEKKQRQKSLMVEKSPSSKSFK